MSAASHKEAKEEHAQKAAEQSLEGLTEASEVESNARKAKALAKLQPDKEDLDKAQKKIAETTGSEKAAHKATEQAKMRAAQEELEAKQQEERMARLQQQQQVQTDPGNNSLAEWAVCE